MSSSRDKTNPAALHFIGIAGSGMAPLAELALRRGFKVSGSDSSLGESATRVAGLGIPISTDHRPENLGNCSTVIYSSAIREENSELRTARERGLEVLHRSDFLLRMMDAEADAVVTVAGSHGKTTTTALLSHVLRETGVDATGILGGSLNGSEGFLVGNGSQVLVAEADESDGSFEKYRPNVAVLTNVGLDHMDYYQTETELVAAFGRHIGHIADDGHLVIGWDNKICRNIAESYEGNLLSFGFVIGCDVRCLSYKPTPHGAEVRAIVERDQVSFKTNLFGRVNVLNALACLGACRALGIDVEEAATAIESFPGVRRRLSIVYDANQVLVADDYAHNPDKIAGILNAIRESHPSDKIVAIFQPHRFSRMETLYEPFCKAFQDADETIVLPVYAAGEKSIAEFSADRIANDIAEASSISTRGFRDFNQCVNWIKSQVEPGQVFVTLGAGDIWRVADSLAKEFTRLWESNDHRTDDRAKSDHD